MAYLDERLANIDRVPDALIASIDGVREPLFRRLIEVLTSMQAEDGRLVLSEANIAKIEELIDAMGGFLFESEAEYARAVREYVGAVQLQGELANDYFTRFDKFSAANPIYGGVLDKLKFNTATLFSRPTVEARIGDELRQLITSYVTSETAVPDAINGMRDFLVGNEDRLGRLSRYARTWGDTAFVTADRQYVSVIGNDLGITKWRYVGGLVQDSRPFCVERAGGTFTDEEIRSWASLDWAGKMQGTTEDNIFEFCGGWNCRHVLMPVE